MHTTGTNDQAR